MSTLRLHFAQDEVPRIRTFHLRTFASPIISRSQSVGGRKGGGGDHRPQVRIVNVPCVLLRRAAPQFPISPFCFLFWGRGSGEGSEGARPFRFWTSARSTILQARPFGRREARRRSADSRFKWAISPQAIVAPRPAPVSVLFVLLPYSEEGCRGGVRGTHTADFN